MIYDDLLIENGDFPVLYQIQIIPIFYAIVLSMHSWLLIPIIHDSSMIVGDVSVINHHWPVLSRMMYC